MHIIYSKQCPLYASSNVHYAPSNVCCLHQQFPMYASNHVQYMHFAAVQCLCLHALPLHCTERTEFAWQKFAFMTIDVTPCISRKGSKAGWSVWAIPVLTRVVCVQSSWGLSSSCSPAGWLETQSASGEAATRTKPGSIWSVIALHFICTQHAAFQVTAVVQRAWQQLRLVV